MWKNSLSAARFLAAAAAAAISNGRPPPTPSVAEPPPVAFEVDNPAAAAAATAAAAAAAPLVEVCKCAAGLRAATAAAIEAINEQPPTFEELEAADDVAVCAFANMCMDVFQCNGVCELCMGMCQIENFVTKIDSARAV